MRKGRSAILVLLAAIGVCGTIWIIITNPRLVQPISSCATAVAVVVAAIALWVNYIQNRRRIAFDSLLKLTEVFHIQLKEDRDNVVDLEIKDVRALQTFLTKVETSDEKAIKEKRSIIRVLNFFALMGMMIQDKFLRGDVVIKYFGAIICHKAGDWTAYLTHLTNDDNYKRMIREVNYVCRLADD